ncbi:MAG: hypothetical protein ACRCSB_00205 [Bacteroidales bacterium]
MKKTNHTESILARLEEYINKRGDNYAQLTIAIGVSVGYFYSMRKTKGSLGAEILARILFHYKDLSADWLLTGRGAMLRGKVTKKDIDVYSEREAMLKDISKTVDLLQSNLEQLKQQQNKLEGLR